MKRLAAKIGVAVMAFAVLAGCSDKWSFSEDIAVNSTRLDISSLQEGTFVLTVYANSSWNVHVTYGADWLSCKETSGRGIGYLEFTYGAHTEAPARIARIELTSSTGKTVAISVVQSGTDGAASSVSDFLL